MCLRFGLATSMAAPIPHSPDAPQLCRCFSASAANWQRTQKQSERVLALRARTGNQVKQLCWFANRSFLGMSDCGKAFYWSPAPGVYTIAATDDQGHTDSTQIRVEADK